jgi:hypothetical protein
VEAADLALAGARVGPGGGASTAQISAAGLRAGRG